MPPASRRLSFGAFEIRPATGELWKTGQPLRLAPQPFAVLALLVERAGELVTREELRSTVWPDGTTVEFDKGLNYCIRQIRIALGDDGREPSYIGTVPKRGYRLLVPVAPIEAMPAADPSGDPLPLAPPVVRSSFRRSRRLVAGLAGAAAVLIGVGVWLGQGHATPSLPTGSEARRLFLEAETLSATWELDKVQQAAERYVEVTRLEPAFPGAWAGLTHADILLSYMGPHPSESLAASEAHARRALELDASLSAAHAALGHSYWQQWRWDEAGKAFARAVAGRGNPAVAHQLYGMFLASMGHADDAVQHARRAVELEPASGLLNFSLAQVYLQTGNLVAARVQTQRTLELDRHFPLAYRTLFRAAVLFGQIDEAAAVLEEESRLFPDATDRAHWRVYLLAHQGRLDEARALLSRTPGHRPGGRKSLGYAAALVAVGDTDGALAAIEESLTAHVPSLIWLRVAPELAPLRTDPRFVDLVTRLHGSH